MRVRAALLLALVIVAGCGGTAAARTSKSPTPSIAQASRKSTSASSTVTGPGRCQTAGLKVTLGKWQGATGNELGTVNLMNQSGASCYLGGYPGVELDDGSHQRLGDAQRSTDSFFGSYAAPHRVDIAPGQSTSFDLTWGGIDPCGATPAWRVVYFKITPPGDYDQVSIPTWGGSSGYQPVCPNTMTVHPVGSPLQQG